MVENQFETTSLAERLRPERLTDLIGQLSALDPKKSLLSQIQAGQLTSLVLWGPPGSGKTSAAMCFARSEGIHFLTVQATDLTVQKIRAYIEEAILQKASGQRTLLFIDEIHRLTKVQQEGFFICSGAWPIIHNWGDDRESSL
jgi:putative ATPase